VNSKIPIVHGGGSADRGIFFPEIYTAEHGNGGSGREWKPGQLIYERLSDRHQLELFTLHEEPRRTGLSEVIFHELEEGPVWTSIHLSGRSRNVPKVSIDSGISFLQGTTLIELVLFNE
jgi:hypothetical protein